MSDMRDGADIGAFSGVDRESGRYKFYAALKYVPVILYAVFVVLSFVAFGLPIATYNSVNSGISANAPGNIYTALANLLEIDIHIRNSVIVLYIAAVIATLYLAFAAVSCFNGKFGRRVTSDGMGATYAGNVCSGFYVVYILFAVLDLTVIYRIFAMDGWLGVIKLGAATVTVLIGELVCIVLSIVCEIVRRRMELKDPTIREIEQDIHKPVKR
ncbi:MAG: hypothetical protein NC184_02945 [Roseburia sp.]|nr:hypothetical protein [Roseburia sp.]